MTVKNKIIIGVCILIISLSLFVAVITVYEILKTESFNNSVIFEAIPIYLGIISFFTKYIMDIIQEEKQSKQYWYRNYILEINQKNYLNFFDESKKMFEEILNVKREILETNPNINEYRSQTSEKFSPIVNEFNIKWNEIISSLSFIKVYNSKFYEALNEIFIKFQDIFITAVDNEGVNIEISNDGELNTRLEELKCDILKMLYNKSL